MKQCILFLFFLLISGGASYCQPLLPESSYLKDSKVSDNAKDFYRGKFKASDDERTESIIDSLNTLNNKTRPFYIYLVAKMLANADGALAEVLGLQCKEFLERNPNTLMLFLFSKNADSTFFNDWAYVVAGEFQIECEQNEYRCIDNSFKIAANNCSPGNSKKLSSFYKAIKKSYEELKH